MKNVFFTFSANKILLLFYSLLFEIGIYLHIVMNVKPIKFRQNIEKIKKFLN